MTTAPSTPGAAAPKKTASAPRRAPAGNTTSGAQAAGKPTQRSLEQHLAVIAEGDVMDPQGLYDFLESIRALASGLAFFVHSGASQLESAARKGARDAGDGRLTLAQKAKLQLVLRRMGSQLNRGAAEDLLAVATGAVKTYALLEAFLDEVESDTVQRPHRSSRGGFDLFGGR